MTTKHQTSRMHRLRKYFFNWEGLLDWQRTKAYTASLYQLAKSFFVIDHSKIGTAQFEDMVARFQLSEEDLIKQKKGMIRLARVMLCVAILILSYCFYQVMYGGWRAVLVAAVLVGVALTLSFRYYFWAFQINERKLGCSFREWYRKDVLGGK